MEKEGISTNEEKKNLSKKEMTEEELNKVAGGWTAKDTAKYDELTKSWHRAQILVNSNLNKAKASGDPVAIQKAQELYDAVVNEKNLRKLYDLEWDYHHEKQMNDGGVLDNFWSTFDYQHYMDWLNGIATDLLGK